MKTKIGYRRRAVTAMLAAAALAVTLSATSAPTAAHAATTFTSNGTSESTRPWSGFGVNEYPVDRNSSGADIAWTSADLTLTESRLSYLSPSLVRLNWYTDWFNPSGTAGVYNWTGLEATDALQIMDYLNTHNIPIQLGLWDAQNGSDAASYYTSQAFATKQADFINEMVNVRGYTNIQFYASINEPNGAGLSYSDWNTQFTNLRATLVADSLPTSILVGPDTSQQPWVQQVGTGHPTDLAAYESHNYPRPATTTIQSDAMTNITSYPNNTVPAYYAEMGIENPDTNSEIGTFGYGLDLVDYGIQSGRADAGALAWCLDGFDRNKNCGMWDISGQHQTAGQLRPWFYTWSLLERNFHAGWVTAQMPETSTTRILAAHSSGPNADWSFALVNRDTQDSSVTLKVPGWGAATFNEYVYSPSSQTVDSNGYPTPVGTVATAGGGLSAGVTVTVPAGGSVVLTTLAQSQIASTSSSSTGNIIDHMTDWSHTYSHTTNLAIDSGNTQYFMGDTGRVKRTTNTTENVTYNITTGISGFKARIYYYRSDTADAYLQTSPDGTTWSTVTSASTTPIATLSNWTFEDLSNAAALPAGTKFLRVVLSSDPNIYGPQLSDIDVFGSTTLNSGLETGQTQPTWNNTVDTGPESSAGGSSNVTSPIMQVSTTKAHTGTHSLRYSGTATSSTAGDYAYMKVFDLTGTTVVVQPNTTLTYWVYPESSSANPSDSGRNSACMTADVDFSDGTALRSGGVYVQGTSNQRRACQALTLDTWNEVAINIAQSAIGKTIDKVDFAYDQPDVTGGYSGYLDDIALSN